MTSFLDRPEFSGQPHVPTPSFTPTEEQLAIAEAATQTCDNLMIEALAGAAKTSTLVYIANLPEMQAIPTLALAFNKKIAEEMKARLPGNCVASTLNALGHRAWGQVLGRRLTLSTRKNGDILSDLIKALPKPAQEPLWDNYSELIRYVSHAKSSGWVPEACPRQGISLYENDDEFFFNLDEEISATERRLITQAVLTSIEQSYQGAIDFDDQIYMSALFPCRFQPYRLTMIDEAQDLSALNHFLLQKIVGNCRLFAVGDPCQAIYGFRGAYGDSMDRLQSTFSMRVLRLSTSFRCPKAVVREAQWRAPHMTAPDWAEEGEVRSLAAWSINDLAADAVIVCRNNAPIFKLAILLLSEGRYPQIMGNDIGKTLLKALQKLGPANMPQAEALQAWEVFRLNKLSKARDHARASAEDFCRCLRIFIERGDTLGAAIDYANYLMTQTGPIKMMTGHKSKGLEFDNIYILDRQLLRIHDDDRGSAKNQDQNVLYVMQTRAKKTLTYITTEGFVAENLETLQEAQA